MPDELCGLTFYFFVDIVWRRLGLVVKLFINELVVCQTVLKTAIFILVWRKLSLGVNFLLMNFIDCKTVSDKLCQLTFISLWT